MIPGIYLLPVCQNGDRKWGRGGRKLFAVTACRLSSPCQPIASCHPVCLAVLLSEINNGEGRGAPVEMCGINLPAPKNRISSANEGGGGRNSHFLTLAAMLW